jgi:hypothetical protein
MKTFTMTAVTIALLTVPAYSQGKGSAPPDPKAEEQKREERKKAREIEQEYNASVKRTTPQTTTNPSDPWQSIRPSTPSKPKQ